MAREPYIEFSLPDILLIYFRQKAGVSDCFDPTKPKGVEIMFVDPKLNVVVYKLTSTEINYQESIDMAKVERLWNAVTGEGVHHKTDNNQPRPTI